MKSTTKDKITDIKNLIKVRLLKMVEENKDTEQPRKPTQSELEDIFRSEDDE